MAPAPGGGQSDRLQLGNLCSNRFKDTAKVSHNIRIPKAQNRHTAFREPHAAPSVSFTYLSVLTTIKLDRKSENGTIEIQHKVAGRMLATKVDAKLSIAQLLPKPHFDIGGFAAQLSRTSRFQCRQIKPGSFDPHPARCARRPPLFKGRYRCGVVGEGPRTHKPRPFRGSPPLEKGRSAAEGRRVGIILIDRACITPPSSPRRRSSARRRRDRHPMSR